ncbi:hypothetical protein ElyMa_000277200 [Elysia marginata]|uniref:Uncharacterized protein n=1 Tax=Elysia marginata TaxID=1093978 RepID=A0AAV4F4W9_9GAST|nr:hypothetical protein ElyMa_000277200 [Elysia marginata]
MSTAGSAPVSSAAAEPEPAATPAAGVTAPEATLTSSITLTSDPTAEDGAPAPEEAPADVKKAVSPPPVDKQAIEATSRPTTVVAQTTTLRFSAQDHALSRTGTPFALKITNPSTGEVHVLTDVIQGTVAPYPTPVPQQIADQGEGSGSMPSATTFINPEGRLVVTEPMSVREAASQGLTAVEILSDPTAANMSGSRAASGTGRGRQEVDSEIPEEETKAEAQVDLSELKELPILDIADAVPPEVMKPASGQVLPSEATRGSSILDNLETPMAELIEGGKHIRLEEEGQRSKGQGELMDDGSTLEKAQTHISEREATQGGSGSPAGNDTLGSRDQTTISKQATQVSTAGGQKSFLGQVFAAE